MDILRILALSTSGFTYALAMANLIISFQVLKPLPFTWKNFAGSGGGFIWLHIVCVVIPFQGFVTWGNIEVLDRLGTAGSWRPWCLLFFTVLISAGYLIIFRVEMARLRLKKVMGTP